MNRTKGAIAALGVTALLVGSALVAPAAYSATVTVPSAPAGLTAIPGSATVVLKWTAPANGGSVITGYNLYQGSKSGHENYAAPVNGAIVITGVTTTVTGLTSGRTYYFTVKAVNAVGSSAASNEAWAIPGATVASAPQNVAATAGFESATVTWSAPSSPGGSAVSSYRAIAADSTVSGRGGQTCSWTTGALSCVVTGLTNGDSYTFTVTATNSVGSSVASGASNAVVPGLSVPFAPTGLSAAPGSISVALKWTAPADGGLVITGYNLYQGTRSGHENYGAPVNGATLITGATTTVTGLTTGRTYYFTVEAVNAKGSSAISNETWAIPGATTASAPQSVTATAGSDGTAVLTWNPPLSSGGSSITGYEVTLYIGTAAKATRVFGSTATTETLTGLSPGNAYTFTVAAINASGTGAPSAASNAVTVPRAGTRLALVLSATKVTFGHEQAEHFSVTVSPNYSGPTPAGRVSVRRSTTTLCVVTLSSAKGSCTLARARLLASAYVIYATYSSNSSFVGSTSAKKSLTVAKATTKTVLKLSAAKVTFGREQLERLSVTVWPQYAGAMPTGSVTVNGSACRIRLVSGKGSCTLSSKKFNSGTRLLVATYWGSGNFKGSASARSSLTILK